MTPKTQTAVYQAFETIVVVVDPNIPSIVASTINGASISQVQPGQYVISFPAGVQVFGCVATQNESVGTVTAVPGVSAGLSANQVSVITLSLENQYMPLAFTLVSFSSGIT